MAINFDPIKKPGYVSDFAKPVVKDQRDKDLQTQFGQMKTLLGAQKAEAQRQGDILYKQALASSGGFGGAGLKLGEQAKNKIEQEYGNQGLQLNAQEAEARQNLASMKSQESLQKQQLAFTEWYGMQELDENKRTNLINAFIAAKKTGGLDDPSTVARMWNNFLSGVYGVGRVSPR